MEIVLLAGGLGTRFPFHSPKCLAPVGGKPFIDFFFSSFKGFDFIVSTGYKGKIVEKYLKDFNVKIVKDDKQNGTYNAVYNCLKEVKSKNFIVMNADSLFVINLWNFIDKHIISKELVSIAAKEINYEGNYVRLIDKWRLYKKDQRAFFHSGIYCFNKDFFKERKKGKLEDFLFDFNVEIYNNIFIDIGNVEEYKKFDYITSEVRDWVKEY